MSTFKQFKSWLSKALKTRLIFSIEEGNYIVSDGYVAYNIRSKSYLDELKMQTFQELDKNFSIMYRQIDFEKKNIELLKVFEAAKEVKVTPIYMELKNKGKARLFTADDKQIFIDENFIKNIEPDEYEIYGTDEVTPIVFKSKELDYAVLPIRNVWSYKITIS